MIGEITLFGEPSPEQAPTAIEGVSWSRVTSSAKCATCVAELVATNGAAPVARTARFRRRTATTDALLCYEHAQPQRHADGLPEFRAPRG
jgi:hypothetical protein